MASLTPTEVSTLLTCLDQIEKIEDNPNPNVLDMARLVTLQQTVRTLLS
jgi:hypothetical protein